jgi:hypothetical protein
MSVRSFPREDECNSDYTYKAGPKKEVVLMGTKAFITSSHPSRPYRPPEHHGWRLGKWVTVLTVRSEGGGPNAEQAARELVETQRELRKTRTAIEELKKFFVKMKKAVDEAEGPGHWTRRLGTSHQCLCLLLTATRRMFASSSSTRRSSCGTSGGTCST